MTGDADLERALWRSRRGMLELDLVLVAFARRRFRHLGQADRDAYLELLRLDDWRIWDLLRDAGFGAARRSADAAPAANTPAHLARIASLIAREAAPHD